ncbi:MAG: type II toxin-antitoxin system RatA family toxin [Hyphomicrobium sp.]
MPRFETVRRVPFTPDQMFSIVADIEKYPLFLPLCESLKVTSRQESGPETQLIATMGIGYKSIHEKFTTKVLLQPHYKTIHVSHLEGPFRYLENHWQFQSEEDKTTSVHFKLEYEFQSRLFAILMGGVFDRAFRHFADTFEQRAQAVYGS